MPNLPPELRRVPPDAFVATRDALSRRLRQDGDREGAAGVRRLRRPPAPLWALNQLADVAPDGVSELIRVGEALRDTTQEALTGGGAALGRLSGEHARLVERLTAQALELLVDLPAPATTETRSRIWTMLRVASLDPALAPALAEGSLAEEPASTGFDSLLGFDLGGAPAPAAPAAAAPPAAAAKPDTGAPGDARRGRERAEELRAAIDQAKSARAERQRRRERLVAARRRAADLRAQAEAAAREAQQAEREAAEADEAVEAAEAAVERLRGADEDR